MLVEFQVSSSSGDTPPFFFDIYKKKFFFFTSTNPADTLLCDSGRRGHCPTGPSSGR